MGDISSSSTAVGELMVVIDRVGRSRSQSSAGADGEEDVRVLHCDLLDLLGFVDLM